MMRGRLRDPTQDDNGSAWIQTLLTLIGCWINWAEGSKKHCCSGKQLWIPQCFQLVMQQILPGVPKLDGENLGDSSKPGGQQHELHWLLPLLGMKEKYFSY